MTLKLYVEPTSKDLTWKKGLAIVFVMTLVFVELAFRVVNLPSVETLIDPVAVQLDKAPIEPHPYLAYALKPGWRSPSNSEHQISHNSLGFRGPEIRMKKDEGTYRILCLGGSSTYGTGASSNATTWPARLQYYLELDQPDRKFEVINLGAEGYSTFESLINLATRGIDLEPDLVIVYHSLADMRCALYPNPEPDNSHWRASWPVARSNGFDETLGHSYVYKLVRRALTDGVEGPVNLDEHVIVDYEGGVDKYADSPGPTGFKSFERNLGSIVSLARDSGAEVLLSTQAFDRVDLQNARSRRRQLASFDRMRALIERVAKRRRVQFVDAGKTLELAARRQWDAEGKENIFTWEAQLQDSGADLLASTFAQAIFQAGLVF